MRKRTLAGVIAVLLVATGWLTARPAAAVTIRVSDPQQLELGFSGAVGTDHRVVLDDNITVPAGGPIIAVPSGQTVFLDLNGHSLDITGAGGQNGIGVPTTATLSITDTAGGGLLSVVGGVNRAGIGGFVGQSAGTVNITSGTVHVVGGQWGAAIGGSQGGAGGTVTVQPGATVVATGGDGGAGIGGGSQGAGGQFTMNGGSVTATGGVEGAGIGSGLRAPHGGTAAINAGTLIANGGIHASGIGGGSLTPGGDVTIGVAANVTAAPRGDASAIGQGVLGQGFGSLSNAGMVTLPQLALIIPAGVVVNNSGTIRNTASLEGDGTLHNTGVIVNTGNVAQSLTVTGNNYLLQFHGEGGIPEPSDQRVFAPTLALAEESLPSGPVRPDHQFTGWYLQADASGAPVSSTTSLGTGNGPTTVPVYAGWLADTPVPTTLSITPTSSQAVAGESVTYTVTGEDQHGNQIDVSGAVLSSSRSGDVVSGWSVTAEQVGGRTITATLGDLTATASLQVSAAPVAMLLIAPPNHQVVAGSTSITYAVIGTDQYGNTIDASGAVLTSSEEGDEFSGWTLAPTVAGERTLTATLGEVTATTTLTVTAAPLATLSLTPAESSATAGSSVEYTVTGADEHGNPIDVSEAVLTSSVEGDAISGWTITPTAAGERTITATLGEVTTTANLTVGAAPLATLTLTPAESSTTAGSSVEYTVTGADQYGNPVDASDAELTSNQDGDEINGWTLTPTAAGERTITATLGEVTTTATLTVDAAPLATLTLTPAETQATAGTSVEYTVTGADQYGNPVDASAAELTSSQESDEIAGWTVSVETAGARTITATLGDVTTTANLTVTAAPAATLSLVIDPEMIAGTTADMMVTATDEFSNPVDTAGVVITSSADSDAVVGLAITPTAAGDRTLTARLGELTAAAPLSVTPAAPANLRLWIEEGQSPVTVGGSLTLGVSATDEFGNPVDTTGVVITSSVATDVIDGLTVSFPTASPHTLTATLGDATASLTVEVIPASEPTPSEEPTPGAPPATQPPVDEPPTNGKQRPGLPSTGVPGEATSGLAVVLVLLVAGGSVLVSGQRRTN